MTYNYPIETAIGVLIVFGVFYLFYNFVYLKAKNINTKATMDKK
jgi:hypothetical protein